MNKTTIQLGPEVELIEISVIRDSNDSSLWRRYVQGLRLWLKGVLGDTDKIKWVAVPIEIFEQKIEEIDKVLLDGFIDK